MKRCESEKLNKECYDLAVSIYKEKKKELKEEECYELAVSMWLKVEVN